MKLLDFLPLLNISETIREIDTNISTISLTYAENPSAREIAAFLDDSREETLRGVYMEGSTYWWDAHDGTHDWAVIQLHSQGIRFNKTSTGFGVGNADAYLVLSTTMDGLIAADANPKDAVQIGPYMLSWSSLRYDLPTDGPFAVMLRGLSRMKPFVSESNETINEATWWHGSGSGDLRGGPSGLHLGTKLAATQALCSRIGYPVEGEWDGTREYGKTLLAGKERLRRIDPHMQTGYNMRAPEHDYYAHQHQDGLPHVSKGVRIDPRWRPAIKEYELTGPMSNTPNNPHGDWKANGYMKGNLKKGKARRGFYYVNDGEDAGSLSITVPGPSHIRALNG